MWCLLSYPHLSVSDSSAIFSQSQNIQVHAVLSSSSQAEAEAFTVTLQVHRVEFSILGEIRVGT